MFIRPSTHEIPDSPAARGGFLASQTIITVRSGDTVRQTAPGGVCLAALTHVSHLRQDRSEALYLFVPRDQVPQTVAARLDRLHNLNLRGPRARLLADHLLSLERNLGDTPSSARADVAAATLELVRACLPGAEPGDRAGSAREQALRERVRRHIRCNVAASIDPGALCGLLGISRSQLYRLFRVEGGVAAIMRAERLAAAREALVDPVDGRRIFQVAESFGFGAAEEFSRAFRRKLGCRPSDAYRRALWMPAMATKTSGWAAFSDGPYPPVGPDQCCGAALPEAVVQSVLQQNTRSVVAMRDQVAGRGRSIGTNCVAAQ